MVAGAADEATSELGKDVIVQVNMRVEDDAGHAEGVLGSCPVESDIAFCSHALQRPCSSFL